MAKNSIRDYANAAASNTDVQGQNIDEGCSPAGINNAIREVMADLADVNDGTISLVSPDFDTATINSVSIDAFPSGTKMLFQQTAAPTGWTKDTTHNDKALRITSGTVGTGGSVAFETAFASQTPAGSVSVTVAGHALTKAQLPSISSSATFLTQGGAGNHENNSIIRATTGDFSTAGGPSYGSGWQGEAGSDSSVLTLSFGGGSSHTHSGSTATFTGTAIDLDVSYVDVIIAAKD